MADDFKPLDDFEPESPKEPGMLHRALRMLAGTPGGVYPEAVRHIASQLASLGGEITQEQSREKIAREFDQLSPEPKERAKQINQGLWDEAAGYGAMVHAPVKFTPTSSPIPWAAPSGLRGALERFSAERALRARKPTEGDTQLLRAQHSTPYGDVGVDAGRVARDMTIPGTNEPVFTALGSPKEQLARLGQTAEHHGPIVADIVKSVDQAAPGKAVDLERLIGRIEGAVAETNTPTERIANKGRTTEGARNWLQRLRDEVATENRVRATSTDVALGEPPQGELGVPETSLVAGPEVTLPPQRQIATEVSYQQGLPLTRTSLHAGPETVRSAPIPREDFPSWQGSKAVLPKSLGGEPVGQTVGVQRDMFGTPTSAAVEGAPVMTQDPALSQSVARQPGLFTGTRFPDRAPPTAEATNVIFDPKSTAGELWSLTKDLQKRVYAKANERYPGNKNVAEAVKNDPEFAFLMKVADIGKQELERTVASVKPELLDQFMSAKEGYSNAQSFLPFTKSAANKEAIGSTTNPVSAGALGRHALFAGAGAGLGSAVGMPVPGAFAGAAVDAALGRYFNPVASRLGLSMSKMQGPSPESSLNAMHIAGRLFPGSKPKTQEELIAELLRQKENR
jgi:hypothetical protein